jgi:hypothetical protein
MKSDRCRVQVVLYSGCLTRCRVENVATRSRASESSTDDVHAMHYLHGDREKHLVGVVQGFWW